MKLSIIFFTILTLFGACSEITDEELDPEEADVEEGYIVDKDESRILVVGDITREEATKMDEQKLMSRSESSIQPPAVWFGVNNPGDYELGQLVRVEFEGMDASYPGQAGAEKIQIVGE
ncbi:hypothetical protein CEY16_13550 [Halalkalibacillus sediminis]|uniref:DUF3221 domain-containing protein n=1 Tax=Halalkalibacillus sediminis TaxID=2018042 RepID=A0A2I0QR75_9BACI|nr:DUF3221 domain-containing protein [Halalkalibacillus sediminis]PKR76834.1 hypothetical protein CEY16_13550 [Halalkalibacillus sediminis]